MNNINQYKIFHLNNYSRIDKITHQPKKRKIIENWKFCIEKYGHSKQLSILHQFSSIQKSLPNVIIEENTPFDNIEDIQVKKIMVQEIKKKIYGYKQQDIKKKKYNPDLFIHYQDIIQKMLDTELLCYYCKKEIYILYDISREGQQWTIDRINNLYGHNKDNFYFACLDCNLKRRCRNDQKFLFTKQLKIVKEQEIKNETIIDDRTTKDRTTDEIQSFT